MDAERLHHQIEVMRKEFQAALGNIHSMDDFEALRIRFAGRKGAVSEAFKSLAALDPSDRREAGNSLNQFKTDIQKALDLGRKRLENKNNRKSEDVTLPGFPPAVGRLHPLTKVSREIKSVFKAMGFAEVQGPEVETEYYNFEALNIPEGHPAREMHDTLFVDDQVVLRTHTSPVQVRVMEKQTPPIRVISPGRCFRRDTPDATHSPVFHQVEGLCVDEGVTFGDLKGVLLNFARNIFGSNVSIRFRPSFFPFTEPSAEVDIQCVICKGAGCRTCSQTGWLEILGAGMVDPEVFRYVHYDPEEYSGFAFGMGIERIAMLKYGIDDIQLFFKNDIRFLRQF